MSAQSSARPAATVVGGPGGPSGGLATLGSLRALADTHPRRQVHAKAIEDSYRRTVNGWALASVLLTDPTMTPLRAARLERDVRDAVAERAGVRWPVSDLQWASAVALVEVLAFSWEPR